MLVLFNHSLHLSICRHVQIFTLTVMNVANHVSSRMYVIEGLHSDLRKNEETKTKYIDGLTNFKYWVYVPPDPCFGNGCTSLHIEVHNHIRS